MTYLLDTHALFRALTARSRLGAPKPPAVIGGYARHLDRLGVARLPLTEEHCLLSGTWIGSTVIRSTGCWPRRR
ncbi:MAG: hypothetical protein QM582_17405 [Micropruina sp.]|uniref:hypothetical protein n=1 Tax=Micropruina sp. TaxID=2737536 RepID=UPI0039E69495